MPATPTSKPAEPAEEAPPRGSRIREVPAGYNLDPLPIKVPVHDGESVVSWLRRVSWRYDTPARLLIRDAGSPKPLTGTSKVAPRLHNNHQLLDRLGLPADDITRLLASTPLAAATTSYLKEFRRATPSPRPWSRYCPTCLTGPDPYWRQDWQHPLLAICPTHHTYLLQACPRCRQRPLLNPAWLSRPIELWRCPAPLVTLDHDPNGRPTHRQRGPSCTHDLRDAEPVPASPAEVAAQHLLLGLADDPIHTSTACGVTITGRIGFDAFLDLVDAATKGTPFDLSHQPADVAARLVEAAHVLTRPDLDTAATAATRLLSTSGPHAPLGPPSRFTAASYNPLLAAVHLHGVRDQLSQADQLMLRTGHREPRYPATLTPKNRRRLRLPDHHPYLPEPDGHRLPQLIWPDVVTAGPCGRATTSGRAALAVALAKIGSTRTWTEIATNLELPPGTVTDIGSVLRRIERQGHWTTVLTTLDRLATRLQVEPAPIDYAARRQAGHDTAALRRALELAAQTHPTDTPPDVLLRHFWELFTGGDIAYAPDPLHIALGSDRYRHYRATAVATLDRDRPLLQTALHKLSRLTDADPITSPFTGPLVWTPVEPTPLYTDESVRLLAGQPGPPQATEAMEATPF